MAARKSAGSAKATRRAATKGTATKSTAKKSAAKKPATKQSATKQSATKKSATKTAATRPAAARPLPITDVSAAVAAVDARRLGVLHATARRPDDLFVADLRLHNLRVVAGSPPTLRRIDARRDAILVVTLPPQSFGEEAFLAATGPEVPAGTDAEFLAPAQPAADPRNIAVTAAEPVPPLPGTRIRMAGPSRLAFTMPDGATAVPFTLDALLDACRTWPVRRSLSATPEPSFERPGRGSGDLDLLAAAVGTADFVAAQRSFLGALRELGALEAESAAVDAGRRVAEQAAAAIATRDPVRAAPLVVQRLRAEVDALAARFAGLRDRQARAVATVAVAYQAADALSRLGVAARPGLEMAPLFPLLPLIIAPHRPGGDVTALELPYRLITSPIAPARWTHRTTAVARGGRHELWHTRLTTGGGNLGPDAPGKLRAIWSDDYPDGAAHSVGNPLPFRMPLDAQDRQMLVKLMAGFDEEQPSVPGEEGRRYRPTPARVQRMILSALGGLLDGEGSWATRPENVDLQQWRHLATLGRDHYVRVVYAGYLLPFGHAASLVKVTERRFEGIDPATPRTKRVAVLRQRFFLVVREPVKSFNGSYHERGGHDFPFTEVELLTRVTPNLMPPGIGASRVQQAAGRPIYSAVGFAGLTARQAFWPMLSGAAGSGDFRFDVAARDRDGRRTTFAMPLVFMSEVANTREVAGGNLLADSVAAGYNAAIDARRRVAMDGASICYAPPDATGEGDPRMPTEWIRFRAGRAAPAARSTTRANVYPECETARVGMRAIQRILGRDDAMVNVAYPEPYRSVGFDGSTNAGEVFLGIVPEDGPWKLEFGGDAGASRSDSLGAIASPAMGIQGMSRRVGPAADLANVTKNDFKPADFFGDARILGGISLADVLKVIVTGLAGPDAPKMVTRELAAAAGLPARVEARFEWRTRLERSDPLGLLVPSADGSSDSPFEMLSIVSTPVGASTPATSTATAVLANFKVNLFGFIVLWFRELRFTAERGRKADVAVDLHPERGVEFGGPLQFVNGLKDLIPGSGFSDPPGIEVSPSGIAASFSLTLPAIQVGVFGLSNVTLGARFSLPFDSKPVEVGFFFSERENPFSLTVSMLGGGGFFAIGVGASGVREIEAGLEAGARLAIDLGVASGSVEIMAGFYFHWLNDPGGDGGLVELSGYVRLHGELDIMGLISASLTFNLALGYTKEGKKATMWGEATLVIEVDVLVFSAEVSVTCRREFAGSESDPTIKDLLVGAPAWSSYCLAFAEN